MAYVKDKKKDKKESPLYQQFQKYLTPDNPNMLEYLTSLRDVRAYIFLQRRAIEFAGWLKQLANALWKDPKDEEPNT